MLYKYKHLHQTKNSNFHSVYGFHKKIRRLTSVSVFKIITLSCHSFQSTIISVKGILSPFRISSFGCCSVSFRNQRFNALKLKIFSFNAFLNWLLRKPYIKKLILEFTCNKKCERSPAIRVQN